MKTLLLAALVGLTCCPSAGAQSKRFKSRAIMDHLAGVQRSNTEHGAKAGPELRSVAAKPRQPHSRPSQPTAAAPTPRVTAPAAGSAAGYRHSRQLVGSGPVAARPSTPPRAATPRPAIAARVQPPFFADRGPRNAGGTRVGDDRFDGGAPLAGPYLDWRAIRPEPMWRHSPSGPTGVEESFGGRPRWLAAGLDHGQSDRSGGIATDAWTPLGSVARRQSTNGLSGTLRGMSTRIGQSSFHSFPTWGEARLRGDSQRIGDFTYHRFSNFAGESLWGTSQRIGDWTYHDFSNFAGTSLRGSSQRIGDFQYHDLTTSTGESLRGSSQRIGNFIDHVLTDSGGNVLRGTTTILSGQSFTDWDAW